MELDDHRFVVAYTAYRDEKNVFAAGFTHLFGAILLQTIQAGRPNGSRWNSSTAGQ
ncbi:hypothetical protein ABIB90_007220 [Bradyrhizobium sp. JR4.1]|uniref:hypothetical protein n=1 Tax=Bradyrhizobium sp. JR4.1 TaxID=3156372 RepID=UPI003390BB68